MVKVPFNVVPCNLSSMNNRLSFEWSDAAAADDEAVLLDLLNTTPVVAGVATDALARSADAREWMRARGMSPSVAQRAALQQVRNLLQDVIRGSASPEVLNPVLDHLRLRPTADERGLQWSVEVPAGYEGAARCVLAWNHLHRSRPGRLRPCANSECNLFLIDRSKPNSARWCSMASCGNRMKARRFHERRRGD